MKKIAVVILNWNGIELLKKFIPNTVNYSKEANISVSYTHLTLPTIYSV